MQWWRGALVLGALALAMGCDGAPTGCPTGQVECDGACVATASDPAHCGGCGQACGNEQVCSNGTCTDGCTSGQLACDRACVDPSTDPRHCGGCGQGCASGQTCRSGQCTGGGPIDPPPPTCEAPIALADTSAPDHVIGDGTAASCTEAALASAVTSGGVITFDCGAAPVTIALSAALTPPLDRDTVIDGGGLVTLDGGGRTRILDAQSPNYRATSTRVVLQRLTLANAQAPATDFTPQNPSNERCAWGYKDGEGGAVRVRDLRLHVIDCVFRDNRAAPTGPDTGGGAIYALGALEVIVVGTSFVGNEGSNGGAVYLLQSDGVFVNTTFEGNRATGEGQNFGGATGCPSFNHAEQGGAGGNAGALGIDGNSVERVELCGVVFRNNHANELGTVFRTPNSQRGLSTFNRCFFDGNHASAGGGAIWMQDMELQLYNSTIANNTSNGLGGGVRIDQGPHGSTILIENSTFYRNVTDRALGGGLVFAGEGLVRNCTFAENAVTGGEGFFGAALVSHGPESQRLRVQNTIFWNNRDDHEWTPMTCSVGNPGAPVPVPGGGNIQWPRLRNGPNMQMDNPCTPDILFADAELGALGDHGGPTPTLVPASAMVVGLGSDCPETDQRGEPRSRDTCAAGAVEP